VFAHDAPYESQLSATAPVRRALRVLFWLEDSLLRDVLAAAIRRVDGIELVLATDHGVEALDVVSRDAVDLVAFDADGGTDVQLQRTVEAFRAASPRVRIVALTSSSTAAAMRDVLAAGFDSAISKSILTSDFGYVLRQSGRNTFFESEHGAARPLLREAPTPAPVEAPRTVPEGPSPLTTREREILTLVSEGTGNKQIGKQLWVTEQTVKFHLSNIYRKLQVSNRTEASRVAHAMGLISLSSGTAAPEAPSGGPHRDDDLEPSRA
jgi:DNA-binding NarL/FixJ family response regulator